LSESGDRLREKTIAQRLVIYKQLKAKAEMYQDLLGMRQDQVRAGIAGLEQEALGLLTSEAVPPNTTATSSPAQLFTESEFAAV
jgi:hypothetical protein